MDLGSLGEKLQNSNFGRLTGSFFRSRLTALIVPSLFILAILAFTGYTWARKEVTLVVDGKKERVTCFDRTVADLLKSRGISLKPEDKVAPPLSTPLKDKMQVVVKQAVPVTITADGQDVKLLASQDTVGNVLKDQGIVPGPDDIVEPSLQAPLVADTHIKVIRVSIKNEIKEVSIPYNTRKEPDPHLARGLSRIIQAGRNGLERQQWQVTYHDGKEVERRLIKRIILKTPTNQILSVGTLQQISRGGQDIRFTRVLEMIATAYTYTGRNTASGVYPHFGVAAVDPLVIPMGTRLYIEGYGYATALDRGSAIVGNRIDLFLESEAQARRWGVRRVKVYLLE